jgi:lipid-binding SYLF domain-containing protein
MKKLALALALLALVPNAALVAKEEAKKEAKAADRRGEIDKMADATLKELIEKNASAKATLEKAFGWAVFDNTKVAIGLSGGGGKGVAVEKGSGARTYMKMGTGGVGLGLGAQSYKVIFMFESQDVFRGFVDKGWQADAGATAAAGTAGANAEASFRNGIALWQFTDAGLMAAADIAGTKYWKNDKLND